MFKKTVATSLTVVSFIASMAMAQDESQTSTMTAPRLTHMNVNDPVGWFPFIGLTGGYMSPNDTLKTESTPGDLKIIGSYFSDSRRSVADFGLGFMADGFTQKSDVHDNFITGGIAEAAWRYNSDSRWQIGPVVDAYIGGGDRFGSTDPTWTSFGGLQLLKEFPVKGSNMFRVGLKALTDISIPGAAINTVSLDLQWGFGADQKAPDLAANTEETTTVATTRDSSTNKYDTSSTKSGTWKDTAAMRTSPGMMNSRRVIEADAANNAVIMRNDARMHFDTGKADFQGNNETFVDSLGKTLADRSDLFSSVEVIGHADQTGGREINMKVSRERAEEVAKYLEYGGLSADKIKKSWKGAANPLYKSLLPEDLQQNRRVDLKFNGVKDQAALEDLLNGL